MDLKQSAEVLTMLKVAYPLFYRGYDKVESLGVVKVWSTIFEHDDYVLIKKAVTNLICSKGYTPTNAIADVKEQLLLIMNPNQLTELEAWGLVRNAISRGSYHAQEEFDKLPEILQQEVGSPNQLRSWARTDTAILDSVSGSNFMRSYKARLAQNRHMQAISLGAKRLSHNVKDLLEGC